ncbi:MAG: flavin reductase [Chitinophagaceae bacterium]
MKRPWNLPDYPVYSLATYGIEGVNMNICTYVTAISMQPKLYAIAVYDNTKTLANLKCSSQVVLQYLHIEQYNLVRHLGQQSGLKVNKDQWLRKRKLLTTWQGMEVLQGAAAYVFLQKIKLVSTKGDHQLFLFEMKKYAASSSKLLTTKVLSDKKIIRI